MVPIDTFVVYAGQRITVDPFLLRVFGKATDIRLPGARIGNVAGFLFGRGWSFSHFLFYHLAFVAIIGHDCAVLVELEMVGSHVQAASVCE
jgi:hypothetical protein